MGGSSEALRFEGLIDATVPFALGFEGVCGVERGLPGDVPFDWADEMPKVPAPLARALERIFTRRS